MHVPQVLRPRVVAEHEDQVRIALEDDRGARSLVLAMGTLAVGALGAGWTVGGPLWPWVGLAAVPVLNVVALGLAAVVGRHSVELVLEPQALQLADRRLGLAQIERVRLEHHTLWIDGPGEPIGICVSGEEEDVRQAVLTWLIARIEDARS